MNKKQKSNKQTKKTNKKKTNKKKKKTHSEDSDQTVLMCAQWVAKDPRFLLADSEDSDQTGRMSRLIGVFSGRTGHIDGFAMLRFILFLISSGVLYFMLISVASYILH